MPVTHTESTGAVDVSVHLLNKCVNVKLNSYLSPHQCGYFTALTFGDKDVPRHSHKQCNNEVKSVI